MPSQYSFPPAARVRAPAEYGRVFEGGRRHSSPALSLHWLRDAQSPRLGLAISRKVDPNAVGRNRIKRQLRDQFRHLRGALPPGAYVVVARPPAAALSNAALRSAFLVLLQRAGALPPADPAGTMTGCPSPSPTLPTE